MNKVLFNFEKSKEHTYKNYRDKVTFNFIDFCRILGYDKIKAKEQYEWFLTILNQKDFCILAHRGSYKTTVLTIAVAVLLLHNPNMRIKIIRKTNDMAQAILDEITKVMQTEAYKIVYFDTFNTEKVFLDPPTKNSFTITAKTKITREPSVQAGGITQTITGNHYEFIHFDDPTDKEDRYSSTIREYTNNVFREVNNVKNPTGCIGLTGTIWHEKDIMSILPKHYTKKKYPLSMGFVKEFTQQEIQLRRESMTPALFSINYELEHAKSENTLIEYLQEMNESQIESIGRQSLIAYVDPAFTTNEKSDYTAVTIGYRENGKFFVIMGRAWKKSIGDTYIELKKLFNQYNNLHTVFVESNQAQISLAHEIGNWGIKVKPIINRENKVYRMSNGVSRNIKSTFFFTSLCNSAYMDMLTSYNTEDMNLHDDAVDSLCGFWDSFNKLSKPIMQTPSGVI